MNLKVRKVSTGARAYLGQLEGHFLGNTCLWEYLCLFRWQLLGNFDKFPDLT